MPRPNILPDIDWRATFAASQAYNEWRLSGEKLEHQERMEVLRERQRVDPPLSTWLSALPRQVHVLVLAEDWCPDVVRHVPVLEALAAASPKIETGYIRRDTSAEITARFHTNGTESVPKFGFFNEDFVWCGLWGPLPEACNELIRRGRACGDLKGARKRVAKRYEADPERWDVVRELVACLDIAASPPFIQID